MAAEADRHFWFRGTRRVILDVARHAVGRPLKELCIADIGCGPGTTLRWLPEEAFIVGVDYSLEGLQIARERVPHAHLVRGDASALPLASATFDLVLCTDLLEHLKEPEPAARELLRILKPGGVLLATVPAFGFLYSSHDAALSHFRRYSKAAFRRLLEEAGFAIERLSFYNFLLFPPVAAVRMGQRLFGRRRFEPGVEPEENAETDLWRLPRLVNRALEGMLASERFILRRASLPFGVSLIAVARRAA